MNDLVILYSGGADSRLMLELAKQLGKTPYCILIDYEQAHGSELDFAISQLDKNKIEHHTVMLSNLKIDSGLTGDGKKGTYENVHEMHVPSRNLMFMGIAASIAESKGIDTIWYGADHSDIINKFPDCSPDWIKQINNVLKINGPNPIKLEAPIINMTKNDVIEALKTCGVNMEEVFSGYGDL